VRHVYKQHNIEFDDITSSFTLFSELRAYFSQSTNIPSVSGPSSSLAGCRNNVFRNPRKTEVLSGDHSNMGCIHSKPSAIHSKPSSSKHSSSKRPFRSSNYDANGEQEAHEAALSHFQVGLGSRRQQEYKKLIAQDQRRSAAISGSKVNRTQVIDGRIWFF